MKYENNQVKLISDMDQSMLYHKLYAREAGASLNDDGLPFYVQQMPK